MNYLLKPMFFCRLAKGYFWDINRFWMLNKNKIKRYQNNQLKKTIKYAFTVPIYKEKYKALNIKPDEIKNVEDLRILPIIKKDDIVMGFPDKIIPNDHEKKKNKIVNTSGSTGRPGRLYYEPYMDFLYLFGWIRILRLYNLNWRKTKISILWDRGDFNRENIGNEDVSQLINVPYKIRHFFNNIQVLPSTKKLNYLIKKIENFNPDLLIGHPGVLREIAFLKKNGNAENINPRLIASGGGLLDNYTKKFIGDVFDAKIINVYASVEGELTAFECLYGNFHVQSDIVYLEILDKDGEHVNQEDVGQIAITRLVGKGTPIIRYIGLNDMARLKKGTCKCGISSQIIDKLEGRTADCIRLPTGVIIPPASFIGSMVDILNEKCIDSVKQFQIIQKKIDEISIKMVFDEKIKTSNESIEELFKKIKSEYQKKLDNTVSINVDQVSELSKSRKNRTVVPVVLSKL